MVARVMTTRSGAIVRGGNLSVKLDKLNLDLLLLLEKTGTY